MKRTAGAEALTDLILETFRLNGRLLAAGDRLTDPFGQTSARWQILGAIPDEPRTVADIARSMGLARQSVQRTADLLVADGLIEYAENPAHRRAKLVCLTTRGHRLLDRINASQAGWTNGLLTISKLDEREIRRALRVIERFRRAVESG